MQASEDPGGHVMKRLGTLFASLLLASGVAQAQSPIGITSAVNPAARAGARLLVVGNQLSQNERIATDAQGQAHIMFVDQSTMSIGPNSELVLDRFVYDPARNTGQMGAQISRGVLRFVGGRISHQGNVEIRTPTATIGIRGAVAFVSLLPDGSLLVMLGFGQYMRLVFQNGQVIEINRPGFGGIFGPGGNGQVRALTQEELNALLAALQGGTLPGSDGNAGRMASGGLPPWMLPPDWLSQQVGNWGGLGVGNYRGLDLRQIEQWLAGQDGANQRLNGQLLEIPICTTITLRAGAAAPTGSGPICF